MTFSDAPRRRPPLRVPRWPKNAPLRYKNNKKSEQFFCKLPNLDGQTTQTLTFFQKNLKLHFITYFWTPPGVVRDGGRDGRPAGPPSPKGPFQSRPTTTPTSSLTLSRQTSHTLFKTCLTCLLSTNPPNKHLTPFTYRPKKINNHLKTSQTTFKTNNFSKKNPNKKPNNKTTQQPNTTKAHTQTHYPTTQTNTTKTTPPLPTPHTTIRTTHRNSMGPYIYFL